MRVFFSRVNGSGGNSDDGSSGGSSGGDSSNGDDGSSGGSSMLMLVGLELQTLNQTATLLLVLLQYWKLYFF